MGFFSDILGGGDPISGAGTDRDPLGLPPLGDTVKGLTGVAGAEAAQAAALLQHDAAMKALEQEMAARERAQGFFAPFAGAAERGVEASGFLADPQAQFNFLQQNPLFKMALENANQQTQQSAAARGRLSAGDTLQQLSQNVLLSAQPLIDRQRQDIGSLINLGTDIATSQANIETGQAARASDLLTGAGAAQASGIIGAANAQAAGAQNLAGIGAALMSFFSDRRLKRNIRLVERHDNYNWYEWDWNEDAKIVFGLSGRGQGVIADEIIQTLPHAVAEHESGYLEVNYGAL